MTRDELAEHMLADPQHSQNRKQWIRELHKNGYWVDYHKKTLRQGTIKLMQMHAIDHWHPDHEHD